MGHNQRLKSRGLKEERRIKGFLEEVAVASHQLLATIVIAVSSHFL